MYMQACIQHFCKCWSLESWLKLIMKAVFLRLKSIIHNILEQYTVIVQYRKNIFVKDMAGSKDLTFIWKQLKGYCALNPTNFVN